MQTPETLIRFDRLRERLIQGGVARRHVRRMLAELADHYDDALREEQAKGLAAADAARAAWNRLGPEDDIAASIIARPELRSLPSRFPRTISALGPAVLWLAITVGSGFLLAGISKALQIAGVLPPPRTAIEPLWLQNLMNAALFTYMRILPVAIGAAVAVISARHMLSRGWTVAGAGAISLLSAFSTYSLAFPTVAGEGGALSIGFGVKAEDLPLALMIAALNGGLILSAYWLAHLHRSRRAA